MGVFQVLLPLLALAFANSCYASNKFFNAEQRLHADLLKNYDKTIRPVKNMSDAVKVQFGVNAISLLDVREYEGTLRLSGWFPTVWQDARLSWNPKAYGGLKVTRIPHQKLWRPDVTIYNIAERDPFRPALEDTNTVVTSDGTVLFMPAALPKLVCDMDPKADSHECGLKVGVWTYDGLQVDINFYNAMESMDMSDYIPSGRWRIVSTSATREVKKYECCPEPYQDLKFTMKIEKANQDADSFFSNFQINNFLA